MPLSPTKIKSLEVDAESQIVKNDIQDLAVLAPALSRNNMSANSNKLTQQPSRFIRAMNRVDLMRKSLNFS